MTTEMHYEGRQLELKSCAYCRVLFMPKRAWQPFCSAKCRNDYNTDVGTEGTVAAVTRLKKGVSVVLHFASGPAAERAVNQLKGDIVRVVKAPRD